MQIIKTGHPQWENKGLGFEYSKLRVIQGNYCSLEMLQTLMKMDDSVLKTTHVKLCLQDITKLQDFRETTVAFAFGQGFFLGTDGVYAPVFD